MPTKTISRAEYIVLINTELVKRGYEPRTDLSELAKRSLADILVAAKKGFPTVQEYRKANRDDETSSS